MPMHYSDPTRESDPHALPDVETFYMSADEINQVRRDNMLRLNDDGEWAHRATGEVADDADLPFAGGPGWYFWYCLPGCLPDGEADGPYATERDAIDAMRRDADYGDEDNGDDLPFDEDEDAPDEDAITTSNHRQFYQYGRLAFEVEETEPGARYWLLAPRSKANHTAHPTLEAAIRAYMAAEQFWPDVWSISDHGNAHRMTV